MRLLFVPTATLVASLGLASSGLAGGFARAGVRPTTARPADDEAPVRLDILGLR